MSSAKMPQGPQSGSSINLTWTGKQALRPTTQTGRVPGDENRPGNPYVRCIETDLPSSIPSGRLFHASLRNALHFIPPGTIDFVYLDPPFMTQKFRTGSSRQKNRLDGLRLAQSPDNLTGDSACAFGYEDQWERDDYVEFLATAFALIRPLLKPTGSIAVHTDHRASHYVRCLLDEHFGSRNFINELIWKYGLGNARATRHFLRKHDNIAVYAALSTRDHYFKVLRGDITPAQDAKYCHADENGRFMLSYGRKYYLKGGKPLESVLDIPALGATDSERTGYPTQKPIRLLETLIEALCPPRGCVLDPCCGSGTTIVTAAKTGRHWIGIDASPHAVELTRDRLQQLASANPLADAS